MISIFKGIFESFSNHPISSLDLMKKILIFFLFITFSLNSRSQFIKPNEVPKNLKVFLDSLYPENKLPVWKLVDQNDQIKIYETIFGDNGVRTWLLLDSLCHIIEINRKIDKDLLPDSAKVFINKNYDYKSVYDTREILVLDKKYYFVRIHGERFSYVVLFNQDGTVNQKKNNVLKEVLKSTALSFFNFAVVPFPVN